MRLCLLGTAGYHPNDRRQTLCLMIPECGVVLDAGTGMYRIARYLQTSELDIYLTHAHLDHVVGLTYLLGIAKTQPLSRITIHGEARKLEAIESHLFQQDLFPKKPPCEWRPLDGAMRLPQDGLLTYFPLLHRGGSVGFRLDWPGRSLAYVTDTTAAVDAPYVDKIRGVDLLIHECYFRDERADWARTTGHSCTTAVAEVAHRAGVSRLVLVHFDPLVTDDDPIGLDIARGIFRETELGEDLMVLEF